MNIPTRLYAPYRRFSSVIIRTDDATPGASKTIIPVQQDIVAHSIMMSIGFTCPTATFAFISAGVVDSGNAWGDGLLSSSFMSMTWSNLHATVSRPTGSFNQTQDLGTMIIRSGKDIVINRITNQSAGATSSIVGTVTLSFSTLSEWLNYPNTQSK